MNIPFDVSCISKRFFEQFPSGGTMYQVSEHSMNWLDTNDRLWVILDSRYGASPMAITINLPENVDLRLAGEKNSDIRICDRMLKTSQVCIELSDTNLFDPSVPILPAFPSQNRIALLRKIVLEKVLSLDTEGGRTPLFLTGDSFRQHHGNPDPYQERIVAAVNLFLAGVRGQSIGDAFTGAQMLLGLGPGATPSGDDFLVGFMGGVYAYQKVAYCKVLFFQELFDKLVLVAKERTTRVSYTYLHYASRGDFSERFNTFIRDFHAGVEPVMIHSAELMLATGHSSGADIMQGFITALAQIMPSMNT